MMDHQPHLTDTTIPRVLRNLYATPTKSLVNAGQVIDETTNNLTKAASCQVIGYGYSPFD